MLVTWEDVVGSPDYQTQARIIQQDASRQFRAIPGADPRVRQAAIATAERKGQLRDVRERLDDRQATRMRELDLVERDMRRTERRRPLGTLLGLASVGVQGLSSLADYRRFQRSEAASAEQNRLMRERNAIDQATLRLQTKQLGDIGAAYR